MAADKDLWLRALQPADSFGGLQIGDAEFIPLKTFARKDAKRYEAENLARTYVIADIPNRRIAAYLTLVCSEVQTDDASVGADDLHYPYDTYPAVKIARLLVDTRYRGNPARLGTVLVELAQGIAREEVCPAVGCRFVVVESKRSSVGFYTKCGFTTLDTEANRTRATPVMFVDLHKAGR